MIELKLSFPTIDDALEAIQKLAGVGMAGVVVSDAAAKPKKETPTKKAEAATKSAFEEAPAAEPEAATAKGKPGRKSKATKAAPTVDELKAHILEHAGSGPDQPVLVKEYVRSFGVAKISDLTEVQRQEAFDGAAEYFGGATEAETEGEDDPMA
jgi:hypothetical protein